MPEKVEALGILLLLLPGFACAYFVQFLALRSKQTELDKVIEALLFSLLLYLATSPFFGYRLPLGWTSGDAQHPNSVQILVNWKYLVSLTGAAVGFAVVYSANINHDWAMGALRWMRVTERTARKAIWNDTFQEIGGMVQVGLSGERKLLGWLRYYSDEADDSSLFLESASWIKKGDDGAESEEIIDGPGILLTKESGIEYIMFLKWGKSDDRDGSSQGS